METVVTMDICLYSMGICSAYIACRLQETCHAPVCLWSDTGQEDTDTYRFGWEVAERWELNVVEASAGISLFDLFRQWNMIPARQVPACSRLLKIEPAQCYLSSLTEGRVAYGYDTDEEDRAERTRERWAYPNLSVWFPLIEWGVTKAECFGYFQQKGIAPPRMYKHFQHANCLPCKNFRQPDWQACAYHYPDVFAEAKALEEETGLRWMQDGPRLSELLLIEPSRKGRRKLAGAEPAFSFDMGCDACALD